MLSANYSAIILALISAIMMCSPLSAQDANEARATMSYLNELVKRAEDGGTGLKLTRTVPVSMTLLTADGVPVVAYRKESNWKYGDFLDFTFDCAAPGKLRMTFMVEPYGTDVVPKFIEPGFVSDVQIRSKAIGLDTVLKDGATVIGAIPTVVEEGGPSTMFRISLEVPSNGKVASSLGPTGNLQVILKKGRQYLRLSGGANLKGYKTDLLPLLKHCARTDPNYTPPPPSVAEIAKGQPIRRHPTPEQLQVALSNYYGLQVGVYTLLLGAGDTSFEYDGFELHDCLTTDDSLVFCKFSGRMLFGGKKLAPLADLVNAMMTLAGPRWVSLRVEGSRWRVRQDYRSCEVRTTSIYCDWVE